MSKTKLRDAGYGCKTESEDDGGFSFHLLSFSAIPPFDICTVLVFDIFIFDVIRENR